MFTDTACDAACDVACCAQVTIWNTGAEGETYCPETFGPTITIVKKISAKGTSTTKVLNARLEDMHISKAVDVKKILEALSVNAGNPAIVMTQVRAVACGIRNTAFRIGGNL